MIGGIVLAGGRSTRMGVPKAGLDWHGTPLVTHVAGIVRAAVDGPVVVVAAPGQHLPALPAGVGTAEDAEEGRGPLQGLLAGLRHLRPHAGIAVAVATDQPLLTPALLRRAAEAVADAAAYEVDGRLQPLGAAYRTWLADVAEERLRRGDRSLRGLLEAVETARIPLEGEEAARLRSLDTPGAYAEALRSSAGGAC